MEVYRNGSVLYRASRTACKGCPHRGTLCKAKRPSIVRKAKTELMDWVERYLVTERARDSIKKRASWAETVFAEMKVVHGLNRATLRGRDKVQIQVLLAMAVHNIKQLVESVKRRPQSAGSQCFLHSFTTRFMSTIRFTTEFGVLAFEF
ncbi:MAG: hypothetical protein HPY58_03080 [Firmicutes bacterium]|nr:hypothetical protein [Bacillota bacterium]